MKMNKIYGLCAVQLIGVGVQLMNRVAGTGGFQMASAFERTPHEENFDWTTWRY